jgi:hypothetical protein
MLPTHIALTTDGAPIDLAQLTTVAAALSKQVLRDFGPIWTVSATIDAFLALEDLPVDYWPIIVETDVRGALGYHEDENGQPFAVVEFESDWSLTASHECLEMLADPYGRRLRAGNTPEQAVAAGVKPGRVEFLVEVCDPSEDIKFAYQVNGVTVSDFYTPHYFDPVAAPGVRYSFTGAIDGPRKVVDGGYLSWRNPVNDHWLQLRMFPDNFSRKLPHVLDLTTETVFAEIAARTSLRAAVDRVTPRPPVPRGGRAKLTSRAELESAQAAQNARAAALRAQIGRLKRDGQTRRSKRPKR